MEAHCGAAGAPHRSWAEGLAGHPTFGFPWEGRSCSPEPLTLGFVYWLFDLITVWRGRNWLLIDLIIQFVCFRHDSSRTAAALERGDECAPCRGDHGQQPQQRGSDHGHLRLLRPCQGLPHHEPTCLYQWTALSPHPQEGKVGTSRWDVSNTVCSMGVRVPRPVSTTPHGLRGLACAYDHLRMYSVLLGVSTWEVPPSRHGVSTAVAPPSTAAQPEAVDAPWMGWV